MHHGLVLDDGRVLHTTPLRGEHTSSVDEFGKGNRVRSRNLSHDQRQQVLSRLASRNYDENRSYNLFTNNCEHLVTEATSNKRRSPQVGSWIAGAGVGLAVLAVTRHPGWALTSFFAGKSFYNKLTKAIDE